jgi:ribosomal protein S18 acetylase RimI-like enzyme
MTGSPSGAAWNEPVCWREAARASDVAAVRELVAAAGVFSAAEIAIAADLVRETLGVGQASGYHFLFAERGDRLGGYTCYGPIPATAGSFELYWIAVRPDHQGRGLGRQLLAKTEERIIRAGGRRIYADTSSREDYARAHLLYAAAGYVEAARLPDFYAPGDAKLVLLKAPLDPTSRGPRAELSTPPSAFG